MASKIISKNDIEILSAATEVLKRLDKEYNVRLDKLRKMCYAPTYQEYWNAKRNWYYFVDVCNNAGIDYCREHAVFSPADSLLCR